MSSSPHSPKGDGLAGELLVDVRRGAFVESRHAVAACAVDASGKALLEIGAVDVPVFLRSSAKPFIAATIVAGGAADAFGFDERELAIMAASHGGEPGHVEAVLSILRKAGIAPSALRCGAHPPAYEPAALALAARGEAPSALHNNCSGKHAGMLALAKVLGAPLETYLDPTHPAQRAILGLCSRVIGEPVGEFLAVDGCGMPVFATSLRSAARAYARWATLADLDAADVEPLGRMRAAMIAQPWFVGGTDRFDTALIGAAAGTLVGKAGAEGVHGNALIARGAGLVLKVVDGSRRAVAPAALELLDRLGALDEAMRAPLQNFRAFPVLNSAGRIVGSIGRALL